MIIGKCCKCGQSEITSYFGDGCVNYECARNIIPSCYIKIKRITNMIPKVEKSDWKILDVNCLEPDFFIVGKYEIKQINGQLEIPVINREQYQIGLMIVGILQDNKKYHYRPTPTKKTHEELAEEYYYNQDYGGDNEGGKSKTCLHCR